MPAKTKKRPATLRIAYIIGKAKRGFTPTEIRMLLRREGFNPVSRMRIYQIAEGAGIKIRTERSLK